MSRYPPHQQYTKPPIVVTDSDVLSGRGVNIAAHPGNERFRTLVTTRADASYCEIYSATEKKAVAEEIVRHIASLEPHAGRFLKREGRGQVSRGLNGPWEELSRREAIKKTCQALRDCNRNDRATYAHGVAAPEDVKLVAHELATSGLALKDRAAKAAEDCAAETSTRLREAMETAGVPEESIEEQLRRQRADPTYVIPGFAMTASGNFAPIAQPGYPAVMQVIGPDGIPIPTHDPVPTPREMPGIYSLYPHPAVDMAPINMEAHLAARAAAGYVHPDDRAAMEEQQAQMEGMAAVANLDSAVAQHGGVEAQEIAVAIAQDAADAFAKAEEQPALEVTEEYAVPMAVEGDFVKNEEDQTVLPTDVAGEEYAAAAAAEGEFVKTEKETVAADTEVAEKHAVAEQGSEEAPQETVAADTELAEEHAVAEQGSEEAPQTDGGEQALHTQPEEGVQV